MHSPKNHSSWFFVLFILWLAIGSIVTFYLIKWDSWIQEKQEIISNYSIRQSWLKFINPLLECELQDNNERQKYIPFEKVTIKRIQDEVMKTHPDIHMGVYVRNLNNGPWFGINENEAYSPASLMKVPVLMTYLRWAEIEPNLLNKKLFLDETEHSTELHFPPSKILENKKEYTIKELLEEMIIYSDNRAQQILVKNIPIDLYIKINKDLGVTVAYDSTPENYLSVKDVATFFRILYNASYLNRWASEYALELLSKVEFNEWLRAWVPNNIAMSHKFWERGYYDENWKYVRQLHDCGIVYYEKYPYLACIVTKWDNFDKNAEVIQNTSKIIFEEISRAFPEK